MKKTPSVLNEGDGVLQPTKRGEEHPVRIHTFALSHSLHGVALSPIHHPFLRGDTGCSSHLTLSCIDLQENVVFSSRYLYNEIKILIAM